MHIMIQLFASTTSEVPCKAYAAVTTVQGKNKMSCARRVPDGVEDLLRCIIAVRSSHWAVPLLVL